MSFFKSQNQTAEAPLSVKAAIELPRIAIEDVEPVVEAGRFAAKGTVGSEITVSAVIFADTHDKLAAALLWRMQPDQEWQRVPLKELGNDHWKTSFTPQQAGKIEFAVEAWWDVYATYVYEITKKHSAGVPIHLELQEGEILVREIAERASGQQADQVRELIQQLDAAGSKDEQLAILLAPQTAQIMGSVESHPHQIRSSIYLIDVERKLAEFGSWYELFPRSASNDPHRHGTFKDVVERLPAISAMGFDVLYFPPIHPIGERNRKGRNNSLVANADDPGSPYAIGSAAGGHEAIHPELGTQEDFLALVKAAREHKLEIALDFAIQCSPDHHWLAEHPGWFSWRPDGTIRHAENPPKKYEDIVNVDFYTKESLPDLWIALRDVVEGWVKLGVTLFRVDNPHTKPLPFWEWLIADIRHKYPDVIFLSEAFTKPAMMARLGKVGFSQSYTYFTWRNTKAELETYFTELNEPPWRDCYRPNFFVNTPDINPRFLHNSGRPGFLIRAALATMGSGLWGMYSGFEICEGEPVPGKEDYLNSEKYEIRARDYFAPENITAEIAQLNRIRRLNPALQTHLGFKAYKADNDNILYFGKRTPDLSNFILVAVNLDPFNAHEATFELPLWEFGLSDFENMHGEDLMNGHTWTWYGKTQRMRLEPWQQPFGIWRIRPATKNN